MHRERSNARYPEDGKIVAVGLYRRSVKSLEEVAGDLGISTGLAWES